MRGTRPLASDYTTSTSVQRLNCCFTHLLLLSLDLHAMINCFDFNEGLRAMAS